MPRALPVPPPLADGIVVVRLLDANDAEAVAAAVPACEPGGWEATPGPYSLDKASSVIAEWEEGRRQGERLALAVTAGPQAASAAPGEFLGSIVFQRGAPADKERATRADQLEGAYWIAPRHRGNGYAARALALAARWALATPPTCRVWVEVDRSNVASRRVAERAGFVLTGVLWEVLEQGAAPGDVLIYERRPA